MNCSYVPRSYNGLPNVIVGGVISFPTTTSEPRVPISRHVAPQYTSLCHRHPIVDDCSFTGLGTCSLELDSMPGFRYAIDHRVRLKPRPFPSPYTISCTGPTSAYRAMFHRHGITPGSGFLGHPTPPRLMAWPPAPASPERALDCTPIWNLRQNGSWEGSFTVGALRKILPQGDKIWREGVVGVERPIVSGSQRPGNRFMALTTLLKLPGFTRSAQGDRHRRRSRMPSYQGSTQRPPRS
jgi:hypothetical protein